MASTISRPCHAISAVMTCSAAPLIGGVLGGCVQDFVTLFFSMRRNGRSLGQMAKAEVSEFGGWTALFAVLAIMVILIAVGVMNVAAMAGLAMVVLIEKTWRWGIAAGRVAGLATLALALAIVWLPWLAPGLHAAPPMMMG